MLPVADGVLFLSLVLAPLLYGSAHFLALLLLALLSLIAFNLIYFARPWSLGRAFGSPWVWLGLFLTGFACLQLLPLSPDIIKKFSPALYVFYARHCPDILLGPVASSVYASDTVRGIIQFLMYGLFFTSILMRLQPDPAHEENVHSVSWQKSEYLKLGCLTGVLSLLFHSIYDFNLHMPANGLYFTVLLALGVGAAGQAYDHAFFRRTVEFIIIFGFMVALFAIVQEFSYNGRIYWIGMKNGGHPVGPFYNYDHYAGFMELCSAVAVGMAVAGVFHTSFFRRKGFIEKVVWLATAEANKTLRYLFMAVVMAATIFMSTSRGGIMSFVLSQIIFFAVVLWAAGRARKQGRCTGILVTVILLVGVMVVWLGPEAFLKRFHIFNIQKVVKMEGPIDVRLHFYQDAVDVVRDFPVCGTGLNTFGTNFSRYRTFDYTLSYLRYTHNDYLQLVTEAGAGGMIFLFGFMIFYTGAYIRVARKLA